jgi:hypothetical protein
MTPRPRAGIMETLVPLTIALKRHPATSVRTVRGIEARVWRTEDGALAVTFTLSGDLSRLRIPPPRPPRRADRLWQHTCFEAFVALKGDAAYREFNFSPSGEWAAYTFRGYRDPVPLAQGDIAPSISVRNAEDELRLEAILGVKSLPRSDRYAPLRLALAAVVEEKSGALSYWALKHPPGDPDFHHPDCFALELAD